MRFRGWGEGENQEWGEGECHCIHTFPGLRWGIKLTIQTGVRWSLLNPKFCSLGDGGKGRIRSGGRVNVTAFIHSQDYDGELSSRYKLV